MVHREKRVIKKNRSGSYWERERRNIVDKEEQTDREMRRISREMVFSIYIKRWDKREADGSSSSFVLYVYWIRVDFIHWFMSLSFGRRPLPVYLEISHKTTAALFHLPPPPPPLCLMCQSGDMKPRAHKWTKTTKFHSADDCRKLEWKDEGQPIPSSRFWLQTKKRKR